MPCYLSFHGSTLPNAVGRNETGGIRISDGLPGHLCYGPYFTLEPGRYIAGYYVRRLPETQSGTIEFDVLAAGEQCLARRTVWVGELFDETPSLVSLEFECHAKTEAIEVRAYVNDGVLIAIDELVIFARQQRGWSGK